MPAKDGGLNGVFNAVSDKAWAFAEWLEAKGLPLASFCDKHHINPLLLLVLIVIGVLLLLMLAMGALGGVSYGTLTVTVTSNEKPLEGATVSYNFAGEDFSNQTDALGKVTISFPKGVEVELSASKQGYTAKVLPFKLEEDTGSTRLDIARKVGNLKVNINVPAGKQLPSGSYVVVTGPGVSDSKPAINGVALFEGLPDGTTITYYLSLGGSQRIPAAGAQASIKEGKTTEVSIEVLESSMTTSVIINVKDSLGQDVDGAEVQLFGWESGMPVGSSQTTYGGSATFNGLTMGNSVYATVEPQDGQYSSYNGRTMNNRLDITKEGLAYDVTLTLVGVVRVCVYDENGLAFNTGTLLLRGTTGTTYNTRSIDQECEEFTGLPKDVSIYPVINANAALYKQHSVPSEAKQVSYSGITTFNVRMEPVAPGDTVNIFVHVSDCDTAEGVRGIKVKVIDSSTNAVLDEATTECAGSATVTIPTCGNMRSAIASGTSVYAVAFDEDYQLGKSLVTVASEGTILDIVTCPADEDNSGSLNVCVYKNSNEFEGADVEIYDEDNDLLWVANTEDDEDDKSNCYVFQNIPDGQVVYAKATNIGPSAETAGPITIVGGETANATIYAGTPPVILKKGNVKICTRDAATNTSLTAAVSIYDQAVDQIIVSGTTSTGGCWLFSGITAESNIGGQVVTREIYVNASKPGYATYNGKDKDQILDMIPNGELTVNVYLPESYPICVQLRASDTSEPLEADIILYYEANGTPIESKSAGSEGTVNFYQSKKDKYFFRVDEALALYEPMDVYEFERDEVSGGECGIIELYDLGTLCDLGVEVLDAGSNVRVIADTDGSIPIRVLKGGERGDIGISNEGTISNRQELQLTSGTVANVTLRLNGAYKPFSLTYEPTDFSPDDEVVAVLKVKDTGNYSAIIEVSENELCSRQAAFTLGIYKEAMSVSVDVVEFDPTTQTNVQFCIYVTDQDGETLTDASVTLQVDQMDGWATTSTRTAAYDEVKECYRGSLTSSMAPKDTNGKYKSGNFQFNILAKRAGITKILQTEAALSATNLCGNAKIDTGEKCDDSAGEKTICPSGYACKSDCTGCEEAACGSLSVSAESATLSIGSGRSTGFCVHVSDNCDDPVTDAQVTARFDGANGWYRDSTATAGFDQSRQCYYIPVAESLAMPTKAVASNTDLIGSKSVSVTAVKGKRTGSTSTGVSITCGCDEESWCEATCICDEDCSSGSSGSLNLFNCLQIAAQNNYYPQGSQGYNPYQMQQAYAGQRGVTSTGPGGGFVASPSTIGLGTPSGGYLGVDWEACKKMFGWGGDSETNSAIKDYVWVTDRVGVITNAQCPTILNFYKSKKYVYVEAANGNPVCCTDQGKKACAKQDFQKLAESAVSNGQLTKITIMNVNPGDLKEYGLAEAYVVIGSGDNKVIYANGKLYSRGFVFGTSKGHVYGNTNANAQGQIVWGMLKPPTNIDDAVRIWLQAANKGESMAYLANAPTADKQIILTKFPEHVSGIEGVVLSGDEDGLESSYFGSMGDDTSLYVVTDQAAMAQQATTVSIVANTIDVGKPPMFVKVSKDSLSYCDNGGFKKGAFGADTTLLQVNDYVYMVGLTDDAAKYCTTPDGATKLTRKPIDATAAKNVGYAKVSSGKTRKTLLVSGADSGDSVAKLIKGFTSSKPEKGMGKGFPLSEKYGVIRVKCADGQTCAPANRSTMDTTAVTGVPLDNFPKGTTATILQNQLIDCVCGDGSNPPGQITATITYAKIQDYNKKDLSDISCSDITVYIKPANAGETSYSLQGDDSAKILNEHDNSCDIRITGIALDKGDLTVTATLENENACASSPSVKVSVRGMTGGIDKAIGTLAVANANTCHTGNTAVYEYTVSGTVTDEVGTAIPGAKVTLWSNANRKGASLGTSQDTGSDGAYSIQASSTQGSKVYASVEFKGLLNPTASTATWQKQLPLWNSQDASNVNLDLKLSGRMLIAINGYLKDCKDAKIATALNVIAREAAATTGQSEAQAKSNSALVINGMGGGNVAPKDGSFVISGLFDTSKPYTILANNKGTCSDVDKCKAGCTEAFIFQIGSLTKDSGNAKTYTPVFGNLPTYGTLDRVYSGETNPGTSPGPQAATGTFVCTASVPAFTSHQTDPDYSATISGIKCRDASGTEILAARITVGLKSDNSKNVGVPMKVSEADNVVVSIYFTELGTPGSQHTYRAQIYVDGATVESSNLPSVTFTTPSVGGSPRVTVAGLTLRRAIFNGVDAVFIYDGSNLLADGGGYYLYVSGGNQYKICAAKNAANYCSFSQTSTSWGNPLPAFSVNGDITKLNGVTITRAAYLSAWYGTTTAI